MQNFFLKFLILKIQNKIGKQIDIVLNGLVKFKKLLLQISRINNSVNTFIAYLCELFFVFQVDYFGKAVIVISCKFFENHLFLSTFMCIYFYPKTVFKFTM